MASSLSREMDAAECRALLESQRVCVVSMIDGDGPYAVPVFYGLDHDALVMGLSEGRKTRALDRDANVCVTVIDVQADGFWRSVQIRGAVQHVRSEEGRAAAIETLKTHNRRLGHAPPAGSAHRPVAPGRLVRVELRQMTGRARA